MAFKLISKYGDFLPILYRIKNEGEEVLAYLPESLEKMYQGILPIVHSHTELDIQAQDIILFDMVGAGRAAEELKSKGYTVIGGGAINDTLENYREYGREVAESAGLLVGNRMVFSDFEEARTFISKNPARYVFKPDQNLETEFTYVSSSPENMIEMLYLFEEECPRDITFALEEYIDGIEMSTEAWFNGEKFILPVNSTMEEKRFMVGGLGQNTGCMGNVVWAWPDDISEYLLDSMFRPIEPMLLEAGYLGPLDINAIWTPEGPYFLEYTPRFGYDAIQAFSRLIDEPLSNFFATLEGAERMQIKQDIYAVAVRVSVPPYPVEAEVPESPILIPSEYSDNIYLSDVYAIPSPSEGKEAFRCSGQDGYVFCIAEIGKRLGDTTERIYSMLLDIEARDPQYRTDIGNRVQKEKLEIMEIIYSQMLRK